MLELNHFRMSRSDLSLIEQTVSDQLANHFADTSSPIFVVAVSGGMDSMCLLHVLHQLDVEVIVSHINYQKRGAASDRDAELVEEVAHAMGLRCEIAKADPNQADGQNFQQWARDLRYRQFQKLKEQYGADGIALAHHEDDQLETILQKVFRGAGLASWSAMDVWDGQLFRPLLEISRTQIEAYVSAHEVPYRTDESNFKINFARNFLRHEWLDELDDFFPGWKDNVRRIEEQAEIFGESLDWIAEQVGDSKGLKSDAFATLSPGLQRALVLRQIKKQAPGAQLSSESLERIEEVADLQTGRAVELGPGIRILRDREHYVVETGDRPQFSPVKLEQEMLPLEIGRFALATAPFDEPNFGHTLYLDQQKMAWPLTIRRWQDGDKIQPLGMDGHQQVAEHLTNRKVPAAEKPRALVVESFDKTICAIIFPPIKNQTPPGTISEHMKCDIETKKCLTITYRT